MKCMIIQTIACFMDVTGCAGQSVARASAVALPVATALVTARLTTKVRRPTIALMAQMTAMAGCAGALVGDKEVAPSVERGAHGEYHAG